jgi:uncharacterized membrane protein HdeD (DUF308 family)
MQDLGRSGVTVGPARSALNGSSSITGVVLLLLGILALVFADVVSFISIVAFAAILVVSGVAELIHALRTRGSDRDRFFLAFLSGLLTIAVGAVLIVRPRVGVAGMGLLIAAWLIATGIFRGVTAALDRYRYWGWDLGYGAVSVVLGVWVAARLPASAMWLLGTVIAIELMARGVAMIASSFALRRERAAAPA